MDGAGTGTKSEQLFAGYAACFNRSFETHREHAEPSMPDNVSIDSKVSLGPAELTGKGFGIAVEMFVHLPWNGPNISGAVDSRCPRSLPVLQRDVRQHRSEPFVGLNRA